MASWRVHPTSGQKGHHSQPGLGQAQNWPRHAQTLNAGFTLAHPID
jgi:hypothetical protein